MMTVAEFTTVDRADRLSVDAHLVSFDGRIRANKSGEWSATFTADVFDWLAQRWPGVDGAPLLISVGTPGNHHLMSGPIRQARLERSGNSTRCVLSGVDEWAWLERRLVTPQPLDGPPWNASSHDVRTGPASTVVAGLISDHCGATAMQHRQTPGLVVHDPQVGAVGTWRYRLQSVADAVHDVAIDSGLAVEVRRDGTAIEVMQRLGVERSNVRVNESLLADFTLSLTAADSTSPITGGAGQDTTRLFAQAGDSVASFARAETFVDRTAITTQPSLQAAAVSARSLGDPSTSMAGVLAAAAARRLRWRIDYDLGDTVALDVQGQSWPVRVEGIAVTHGPAGLSVAPVIGPASASPLADLVGSVRDISAQLRRTVA